MGNGGSIPKVCGFQEGIYTARNLGFPTQYLSLDGPHGPGKPTL
jgi:hypothetical protein